MVGGCGFLEEAMVRRKKAGVCRMQAEAQGSRGIYTVYGPYMYPRTGTRTGFEALK